VSGISITSIVLAVTGFIWAMVALGRAQGPFIVHFNDLQRITAIGSVGVIVFMGIFGIVAILLNGFLALEFQGRNQFLGALTAALTLAFAILLFIAFAAILSVN